MHFLPFFSILSFGTLASILNPVDIVTSGVYSNVVGIGYSNKSLSPKDYLLLDKEKHLLNFRPLWKKWCKSLNTKEAYEAAKVEIGAEDFWKIVDGECLVLGPLSWMTAEDIKTVDCAPLHNVPFSTETKDFNIKSQELLVALIDRTKELTGYDTLGFLFAKKENRELALAYFDTLAWDNKHWDILIPNSIARLPTPDYLVCKQVLAKMLPPNNVLVTPENQSLILARLITFLRIHGSLKDLMNPYTEKFCSILPALKDTSLKPFFLFFSNLLIEEEDLLPVFDLIPEEMPYVKLSWVQINETVMIEWRSSSPKMLTWFQSFPFAHPNLPIVYTFNASDRAHFRHGDSDVPEHLLKYLDDSYFSACEIVATLSNYSPKSITKFAGWHLRVLPPNLTNQMYFPITQNENGAISLAGRKNIVYGIVADEHHPEKSATEPEHNYSCPSLEFFQKMLADFEKNPFDCNGKSIFTMALTYGYPLNNVSEQVRKGLIAAISAKPLLFEIFRSAKTVQIISDYVFANALSSEVSLTDNSSIIEEVKICNTPLDKLTDTELSSMTPRRLSLYLRENKWEKDHLNASVRKIHESLVSSSEKALEIVFKAKSECDRKAMIQSITAALPKEKVTELVAKIENACKPKTAVVESDNTSNKKTTDNVPQTNIAEESNEKSDDSTKVQNNPEDATNKNASRQVSPSLWQNNGPNQQENTNSPKSLLDNSSNLFKPKVEKSEKGGSSNTLIYVIVVVVVIAVGLCVSGFFYFKRTANPSFMV